MSKGSLFAASTLGAVMLSWGGQIQAQTAGAGPYYATPSWDQTLPAATRFLVLTNFASEAVLDRETGLVWQRTPLATTQSFGVAFDRCMYTAFGGRYGWRLPTIAEGLSLFDPNVASAPFLPVGHPFILGMTNFVSFWSTTVGSRSATAVSRVQYGFDFSSNSKVAGYIPEANPRYSWCVRGPGSPGNLAE